MGDGGSRQTGEWRQVAVQSAEVCPSQRLCQGDTWRTGPGSVAVLLNNEEIEEAPSPLCSAPLYFHNAKPFETRKAKTFPFAQSPSAMSLSNHNLWRSSSL